jgi:hypothetical protein
MFYANNYVKTVESCEYKTAGRAAQKKAAGSAIRGINIDL